MKPLKRRILDLSYQNKLSHIGSCLTAVDIIDDIYQEMIQRNNPDDRFVLSSGHAGLALYVVLEKYFGFSAQEMLDAQGIHPTTTTDRTNLIHCSTGSLGLGLPIALGMAIPDPYSNVYCLISDGECAEGSVWETLNFLEENYTPNLKISLNFNGLGAYRRIDKDLLHILDAFKTPIETSINTGPPLPFLAGLDAHYKVLSKEEYESAIEL